MDKTWGFILILECRVDGYEKSIMIVPAGFVHAIHWWVGKATLIVPVVYVHAT